MCGGRGNQEEFRNHLLDTILCSIGLKVSHRMSSVTCSRPCICKCDTTHTHNEVWGGLCIAGLAGCV